MLKWLLVAALIALLIGKRHLLGDLVGAVKRLPRDFKRAKDPESSARDVTPER